jgi:CRISPR-associated endoribonuclease Cas6
VCSVTDLAFRPVSHAELADGPPAAAAELTFWSPVYFSHSGASVVVPQPWLIAGSWRKRWNASLPGDDLAIGDDHWQEISHLIQLTDFSLRTGSRDTGHGRHQKGFTGNATLRLDREAGDDARCAFGALARFAEFCGTGAQATHGFGATSATVIASGPGAGRPAGPGAGVDGAAAARNPGIMDVRAAR